MDLYLPFFILISFLGEITAEQNKGHSSWGYGDTRKWIEDSPKCALKRQSPIDIANAKYDSDLGGFIMTGYEKLSNPLSVQNNGHTVVIAINPNDKVTMSGASLPGTYRLHSFHFHWGGSDDVGSEHTYEGDAYPLEMHMVHYNERYSSLKDAIDKDNGLAVLGVWFEVGKTKNKALSRITDNLSKIKYSDSGKISLQPFGLYGLFPKNLKQFYRYDGSLTTPPCEETVTWSVFHKKSYLTAKQLEAFRSTLSTPSTLKSKSKPLVNNYRPLQKLNDRVILSSFQDSEGASNRIKYSVILSLLAAFAACMLSR